MAYKTAHHPPNVRDPSARVLLSVQSPQLHADMPHRVELSGSESALRLPVSSPGDRSAEARPDSEASPLWRVGIEVLFPSTTTKDGTFLSVESDDPAGHARAAVTLAVKNRHVDVSLTTPAGTFRIFRDPRPLTGGAWQRFRLAVRFGSERYGLAQLLYGDVLVANYTGPLGA